MGIPGIPLDNLRLAPVVKPRLYYAILVLDIVVIFSIARVIHSRTGRALGDPRR
jgi:ABC-type branched-subunit amino acid transport system permease subunit